MREALVHTQYKFQIVSVTKARKLIGTKERGIKGSGRLSQRAIRICQHRALDEGTTECVLTRRNKIPEEISSTEAAGAQVRGVNKRKVCRDGPAIRDGMLHADGEVRNPRVAEPWVDVVDSRAAHDALAEVADPDGKRGGEKI